MTPNTDDPHDIMENGLTAEEAEEAERPRRSLWGLVALVVVAAVVLAALMLLRNRGATSRPEDSETQGKVIEAVEGMTPLDGVVSVWVAEGVDLGALLSAEGVDTGTRTDLGEGRWVIEVPEGSEVRTISALRKKDGVHDAGRVYER